MAITKGDARCSRLCCQDPWFPLLPALGVQDGTLEPALFKVARDREYCDIITGCDDVADAPQAMAAACDFRHEQLCGKQAGLDQLDEQSASGHPRPGYSHNHRAA